MMNATEFHQRIEALLPFTVYGSEYNRSVNTHVRDAQLFANRANLDAAVHHLLMAEVCADKMTWDEFVSLDPFRPAQQSFSL